MGLSLHVARLWEPGLQTFGGLSPTHGPHGKGLMRVFLIVPEVLLLVLAEALLSGQPPTDNNLNLSNNKNKKMYQ